MPSKRRTTTQSRPKQSRPKQSRPNRPRPKPVETQPPLTQLGEQPVETQVPDAPAPEYGEDPVRRTEYDVGRGREGLKYDDDGEDLVLREEYDEDGDTDQRAEEFYCPGCGRRYGAEGTCEGIRPENPHAPIDVVSTAELEQDADHHTPAPNTGEF